MFAIESVGLPCSGIFLWIFTKKHPNFQENLQKNARRLGLLCRSIKVSFPQNHVIIDENKNMLTEDFYEVCNTKI